jgi:hypothetical protein
MKARIVSIPGSMQIPACRVREDSPHLRQLWKLWEGTNKPPEIGLRKIRAFSEREMETREITLRSGLAFDVTTTATILLRIIETMEAGRPSYCSSFVRSGRMTAPETRLFVSFLDLLEYMRKDLTAGQSNANLVLSEQGILIRPRKVAVAVVPCGGGTWSTTRGVYVLSHRCIDLGRMMILNGRPDIVKEIIAIEARYEAGREGGPYEYSKEKGTKTSLTQLWKTELRNASYDMD